ncbi:MAG: GNAT family N-acetyltransferase [Acidobacteriota bacterium]
MIRLVVRELRNHSDFVAAQRIAQQVWGFEDLQVPSTFDLQVAGHVGGLTAGAFWGRELAGFVHGLPRTNLGRPCHHSHLLAVRPEFRGRGVSVRLKLFQRRWCLERDIRRVTWTYDPLLVPNARLNLVRLRARACAFLPNVYGELGGLYGPLPTDRFEVLWRLGAEEVARAARGIAPEPHDALRLPRATARRLPRAGRLAVEIPAGAPELYAADPAAARRARTQLRRVAETLFDRGYEAVSLVPLQETALYVFER